METTEQKTILITGGTGFLGSHLCHRFMQTGHRVICLDNNMTGTTDNIKDLLDCPNFTFVEHDVIYPFEGKVDEIFKPCLSRFTNPLSARPNSYDQNQHFRCS